MMTEAAKINLSNKELELICNSDWIFTKHIIIDKVYQLLGNASRYMQRAVKEDENNLPAEFLLNPPKIYRGENYRLLPYVMLDYPRHFLKEDAFAIRTLFWWGNFFSVTMHVSGSIKDALQAGIIQAFDFLAQHNYSICINEKKWEHHFSEDNYVAVHTLSQTSFKKIVLNKGFVKIAKKIPLQQWDAAELFINKSFQEMLMLAQSNQAPSL